MSNNLAVFSDKKYSDLFYEVFSSYGSIAIECQVCGRTHFSDLAQDYDDGEYERLEESQAQNRDKYISHNCEYISWFYFNGKQVVFDCPCNYAAFLEQMLWTNRQLITEFIKQKANAELMQAQKAHDQAVAAHESAH